MSHAANRNPKLLLAGLFVAAGAVLGKPVLARETALVDILDGMEQVQKLKKMDDHKTYELDVEGSKLSGVPDDFLRRRTPEEILKSGLTCGGGDYSYVFYRLMQGKGFEVQYIDSAQLSLYSLIDKFDGHTAVAVKDKDSGNWVLVDPSLGKIVSGDWDSGSRLYAGPAGRFWIGYAGPLEKYPVKGPAQLKKFYTETLSSVPRDVWEKELLGFDFTIDDSMKTKDGGYTNPHVLEFIARPQEAYKTLGVTPARSVKVTLKDGGGRKDDDCSRLSEGAWSCEISRGSKMSLGLTDWMEKRILWGQD